MKVAHDFNRGRFFLQSYIRLVTFMHEKRLTDKVGGFDETLPVLEDLDLYFRLAQDYDFVHVPRTTAEYRIREDETNAVTALTAEFQECRQRICLKYVHMIFPELIKFTAHKDGIVESLLERVATLEARLRALEEERR